MLNNCLDLINFNRIYFIKKSSLDYNRQWQWHHIEQRSFSVVSGWFFCEKIIAIDNWNNPNLNLPRKSFILNPINEILFIPAFYVSSIQSIIENSKLIIMSDYVYG